MGRQTVQHDRFGISFCQQGLIQAKAFESLFALGLLLFLTHGCPNICIQRLGAANRRHWIAGDLNLSASNGKGTGLIQHPGKGLKTIGTTDAHIYPQKSTAKHQRVGHVVSIPDV